MIIVIDLGSSNFWLSLFISGTITYVFLSLLEKVALKYLKNNKQEG